MIHYCKARRLSCGKNIFPNDDIISRNKDLNTRQTRDYLWATAMVGGIAGIWGDRIPGNSLPTRSYENKDQLKTFSKFFQDNNRLLLDMVRANNLTSNTNTKVLYSAVTESYILYRENSDKINIDLSEASKQLPIIAVDTKKTYSEVNLGTLSKSNQTITLPYSSNWAIAVGSFD